MELSNLKSIHKRKEKKRIARGGKKGTTSGRGTKGQKSRAGRKIRPAERDIIKKFPKLRGYRFKGLSAKSAVVNLRQVEQLFQSGETVSPEALLGKRLISRRRGRLPAVKILGDGELKKSVVFENCSVSESARKKIEKAGGSIKI